MYSLFYFAQIPICKRLLFNANCFYEYFIKTIICEAPIVLYVISSTSVENRPQIYVYKYRTKENPR